MSLDLGPQPTSDTRDGLGPLHSNEIIIGLALGSPRENTFPSLPDEYYGNRHSPSPPSRAGLRVDYSDDASQLSQSSPPRRPARTYISNDGLKRSGSKWKNLGSLFSKKGPSAPPFDGQPFYMLDRPVQRHEAQNTPEPVIFEQASAQDPPRRTISPIEPQAQTICSAEPPRQTGAKAMLRRASTRRLGIRKRARAQTAGSLESSRGSPARMRLEEQRRSEEVVDASTWLKPQVLEHLQTPAGSQWLARQQRLLEVEIPSVELERYSVMFGDVLQNKPGKPSRRSSRRQSQLREFKPAVVGKENIPCGHTLSPLSSNPPLASNPPRPEHSRMDSSSSSGSKSSTSSAKYGLFPSAGPLQKRNTAHKPPPKPSPLSRSVTAPNASATSLQRPTTSTSKSLGPDELMIVIQETEDAPPPPPEASSTKPPKPDHRRTSSFNPSDLTHTTNAHDDFDYDDQYSDDEPPRPSTANPPSKPHPQPFTHSAFPVRKSSMRVPKNSPSTTPPIPSAEILPRPAPLLISKPLKPFTTIDRDVSVSRPAPLSIPPKSKSLPTTTTTTTGEVSVPAGLKPSPVATTATTGEVSIARQISITRRQPRTVVPIVPQAARQVKLGDDTCGSAPPFPVRKDSHQSYEVAVEG